MDQRGKKSLLVILIESVEQVLSNYRRRNLFETLEPNLFNADPFY